MEASDQTAETAARQFADGVARQWQSRLGDRLLGAYLIGSLAHGGFSRRYSDIDMALTVAEPLSPTVLDALRADAAHLSAELAAKLSIFWTDRSFAIGRFPPLDRLDYLDHAVPLIERERIRPPRPSLTEVRTYLAGSPFERWRADAMRFAGAETLDASDRKSFLRTLLYPARLAYSGATGRMASNDDAVASLDEHVPSDLDVAPIRRALEYRHAGADTDGLFPLRVTLPRQVTACERLIADWAIR